METTEIKLSEYYNKRKNYRHIPEMIFNALEAAFLDGKEMAIVPKDEYEKMMIAIDYAK